MGWTDSHLHQFKIGDTVYATPDPDDAVKVVNEQDIRLNHVINHPKTRFIYEYDFGDEWIHDILLESISPL